MAFSISKMKLNQVAHLGSGTASVASKATCKLLGKTSHHPPWMISQPKWHWAKIPSLLPQPTVHRRSLFVKYCCRSQKGWGGDGGPEGLFAVQSESLWCIYHWVPQRWEAQQGCCICHGKKRLQTRGRNWKRSSNNWLCFLVLAPFEKNSFENNSFTKNSFAFLHFRKDLWIKTLGSSIRLGN